MEDLTTNEQDPDYSDKIPSTKRYWKEPTGHLCSICLEPDHQARDCNHQLCLTCGAIDEHITRECPVSLVCHGCGSRGHLSRHCPSASRMAGTPCARCRSTTHLTLNCPSIWRDYEEEPNRNPRKVRPACYYCGQTGEHFGDECPFRRSTLYTEPSAFSSRSIGLRDQDFTRRSRASPGPGRYSNSRPTTQERPSSWKVDSYRPGLSPEPSKRPTRPGRRDRERMARARNQEDDMEDDWFSNRHANPPPKENVHPLSKDSHKSNRVGGSYKGGYIK